MFGAFINDAKSAIGSVLANYAVRATVAAPFIVALGYATAATTLLLVERFGAITAYWVMAGAFAAIGLAAAVAIAAREEELKLAEAEAEESAKKSILASEAATQAVAQMPLALLGALMTTPAGAALATAVVRALGRNLPLVLLLALVAALFWPKEMTEQLHSEKEVGRNADCRADDLDREAA